MPDEKRPQCGMSWLAALVEEARKHMSEEDLKKVLVTFANGCEDEEKAGGRHNH